MTAAEYHPPATVERGPRRKAVPGLLLRAFAVFGAFTVVASGAAAHACGFLPSQLDLAVFGFLGGAAGTVYAAIFERPPAGQ